MKAQNWVRLSKNLSTLIVIVSIAIFFYVYKPQKKIDVPVSVTLDSTEKIIIVRDTIINPNTATFDEFLCVGMTEKQAKSCINYRSKGGHFYNVEDVKKIYTISADDFERIKIHIRIPQQKRNVNSKKQEYAKSVQEKHTQKIDKKIQTVHINVCDTVELLNLPHIGSFRAKKIMDERKKLGGFYSINQLLKIYSLDSSVVRAIAPFIIIDTAEIRKININKATFKELVHHPLISYDMTKKIVNYRQIVGQIHTINELVENNIVTQEDCKILQFYVKTID